MKKSVILMIVVVLTLSVTVLAQPGPGGRGRGPGGPGSWRQSQGDENIGPWVQRMLAGQGRGFEGMRRPERDTDKAPAVEKDKTRPEQSKKTAGPREKAERKSRREKGLQRPVGKTPQRGHGRPGMGRGQRGSQTGFQCRGRGMGPIGSNRAGRMGQGFGRGRGIGPMGRGIGRGRGIGQMGLGRGPVGLGMRISAARRAASARVTGPFGGRNPAFGNKRGPLGDRPGIGDKRAEMFKKMQMRRANMGHGSRPFGPMGPGPR